MTKRATTQKDRKTEFKELRETIKTINLQRIKLEEQHLRDLIVYDELMLQLGEAHTENAKYKLALRNVLALVSSRKELRKSEDGKHLMRFCAEAGIVPTILRDTI